MVENEKDSNYELFSLMPTLYYRLSLFIPASLSLSLYIYIFVYVCTLSIYIFICMYAGLSMNILRAGDKSLLQRGFF